MSDCPSTSLVKMPSARVAELATAAIKQIDAARARRREKLEVQIQDCILASERSWWRRRFIAPTRSAAIAWLAIGWDLQLVRYHHADQRDVAERLLLASKEADEVWVSLADLWLVSP